jgi:hypothetical protein
MKVRLQGHVPGPAAALVGVWDPLLPGHLDLLEQLRDAAADQQLTPLVVLLDPDPGVIRFGAARWPSYFDLPTRIQLIEQSGCAVAIASFTGRGLRSSAAEFFRALRTRVRIEELWLGAHQPLGPGASGSSETVARLADRSHLRIVRLPENDHQASAAMVRRLVSTGQIRAATQRIGRPPMLTRPTSGWIKLAWPSGQYRALALNGLGLATGARELELTLTTQPDGRAGVEWPDTSATHLAFVAGPADREACKPKEVTLFRLDHEKVKRILLA